MLTVLTSVMQTHLGSNLAGYVRLLYSQGLSYSKESHWRICSLKSHLLYRVFASLLSAYYYAVTLHCTPHTFCITFNQLLVALLTFPSGTSCVAVQLILYNYFVLKHQLKFLSQVL
jgi:hypothetical protein